MVSCVEWLGLTHLSPYFNITTKKMKCTTKLLFLLGTKKIKRHNSQNAYHIKRPSNQHPYNIFTT